MRRLGKITKEMRPSHRIDVLTSGLIHYPSKACWKLGVHSFLYVLHVHSYYIDQFFYIADSLPKRIQKAREVLQKSSSELKEISDLTKGILYA